MSRLNKTLTKVKKYLFSKLLLTALMMFAFSIALSLYQAPVKLETQVIPGINQASPEETPKTSEAPSLPGVVSIDQKNELVNFAKTQSDPTPSSEPVKDLDSAAPQTSPAPTSQPSPQTSLQTENQVNLQISEPDGNFSLSVTLKDGDNLCHNLSRAKDEGKIRSLTIDDSYMSSFGSSYVREINGYQNNWTVSVEGNSPKGCSLYNPKPGESINWKFN